MKETNQNGDHEKIVWCYLAVNFDITKLETNESVQLERGNGHDKAAYKCDLLYFRSNKALFAVNEVGRDKW